MAQRSTKIRRLTPMLVLPLALLLSSLSLPAASAEEKKPTTPFQGFSSDNDKPVNISADQLETHQDEQMAIFTGHVVATQGESVMNSDELTVYYESADAGDANAAPADAAPANMPTANATATSAEAASTADAPAPAPAANKVKKLVAKGNVVVTAQDQKATGDDGILDMETNIATMTGQDVLMSQGCNALHGKKLVVNTKTGLANVTGGTTGHFISGDQKC